MFVTIQSNHSFVMCLRPKIKCLGQFLTKQLIFFCVSHTFFFLLCFSLTLHHCPGHNWSRYNPLIVGLKYFHRTLLFCGFHNQLSNQKLSLSCGPKQAQITIPLPLCSIRCKRKRVTLYKVCYLHLRRREEVLKVMGGCRREGLTLVSPEQVAADWSPHMKEVPLN